MKITMKDLTRSSLRALALSASIALAATPLMVSANGQQHGQHHKPAAKAAQPAEPAAASSAQNAPAKTEEAPPQPESNKQMAERLDQLGQVLDAVMLNFYPDYRLGKYMFQISNPPDTRSKILLKVKEAYEYMGRGQSKEAVAKFTEAKNMIKENKSLFEPEFYNTVREYLAISYLRVGEQDNCIQNHGPDSCILPLEASAFYKVQDGPRGAIREYSEILADAPDDMTSRWLLNIAYMTVGEYPTKVPKQWLISPDVFKSEYQIKPFVDMAGKLGLDRIGLLGGSIAEDLDGDGFADFMASSTLLNKDRDQLRFYHNNGDGTFTDRTTEAGLIGIVGGANMVVGDFNNDGSPDIFMSRGGWLGPLGQQPPSLLRNDGKGHFTDVTEEAGMMAFEPSHSAAWGDYDNDGWLDLAVAVESILPVPNVMKMFGGQTDRMPPSAYQEKYNCHLYHNNHDGTFTDVANDVGISLTGTIKGIVFGDFNNDNLLDIYASDAFGPNKLYQNMGKDAKGKWKFADVSEKAGVTEPINSFPTWFFDYNNDGWLDIFVAGYTIGDFAHKSAGEVAADYLHMPTTFAKLCVYRNNHDGTFTNVSKEMHIDRVVPAMGANFGDFDNDGYPDMYIGTGYPDYRTLFPNRLFRNDEGKLFQDVTTAGHVGHIQKGHGVSFIDIDGDGNLDIFTVIGGQYPGDLFHNALFMNPGYNNHWVELQLEGVQSNRIAIGSRIKVTVNTKGGTKDYYTTVLTGSSYGGTALRQHIGLGKAVSIREIEITWPTTGKTQVFKNVKLDEAFKLREDSDTITPVAVKRLHIMEKTPATPAPRRHKG